MNQLQSLRFKLITWLVIFVQITAALGVGTVTAIQPTPQMVNEAAQRIGLGSWFADATAGLTQFTQPLFGTAKVALAATLTVNTTADNTTASDGNCTLREAITNANANSDTTGGDCAAGTAAADTIHFNITGAGAHIIQPLPQLIMAQTRPP